MQQVFLDFRDSPPKVCRKSAKSAFCQHPINTTTTTYVTQKMVKRKDETPELQQLTQKTRLATNSCNSTQLLRQILYIY